MKKRINHQVLLGGDLCCVAVNIGCDEINQNVLHGNQMRVELSVALLLLCCNEQNCIFLNFVHCLLLLLS